jgi:hypothetical protein
MVVPVTVPNLHTPEPYTRLRRALSGNRIMLIRILRQVQAVQVRSRVRLSRAPSPAGTAPPGAPVLPADPARSIRGLSLPSAGIRKTPSHFPGIRRSLLLPPLTGSSYPYACSVRFMSNRFGGRVLDRLSSIWMILYISPFLDSGPSHVTSWISQTLRTLLSRILFRSVSLVTLKSLRKDRTLFIF